MSLDYAVIGVGNMGQHHARVAAQHAGFNLVGVADSDMERATAIASQNSTRAYSNLHDLLAEAKPQAISICVPSSLHLQIAREALAAGLHILVEKPIADTVANGTAILEAAAAAKRVVLVGHIERYNPAVREVKRFIDSGELGEVNSIMTRRVGIIPPQIRDADIAVDLAIHDIDILCYLMGEQPRAVYQHRKASILEDRDDCVEMFFEFSKGAGIIQANWITPVKIRRLNVTGSKGYLTMDYIDQTIEVYQGKIDMSPDSIVPYAAVPTPKHQLIELSREEPLVYEMEYFARLIKDNIEHDCRYAIKALEIALSK